MGQPGNTLINHLGITNTWNLPVTHTQVSFFSIHSLRAARYALRVYVNSGIIHLFHIFASEYWFSYYTRSSLPIVTTFKAFSKFYRLSVIKNERLHLKKKYVLRKNSDTTDTIISAPSFSLSRIWFFIFTSRVDSNSLLYDHNYGKVIYLGIAAFQFALLSKVKLFTLLNVL